MIVSAGFPLRDYGARGCGLGLSATTLKIESTRGKMNVDLIILRVASERRDA